MSELEILLSSTALFDNTNYELSNLDIIYSKLFYKDDEPSAFLYFFNENEKIYFNLLMHPFKRSEDFLKEIMRDFKCFFNLNKLNQVFIQIPHSNLFLLSFVEKINLEKVCDEYYYIFPYKEKLIRERANYSIKGEDSFKKILFYKDNNLIASALSCNNLIFNLKVAVDERELFISYILSFFKREGPLSFKFECIDEGLKKLLENLGIKLDSIVSSFIFKKTNLDF